jgi:hypothetical protein
MSSRLSAALAAFSLLSPCATHAANAPVTVAVDVSVNRHTINPMIYGVSLGTPTDIKALNAPLNRQGGNTMSTYNWQINADNHDFDYFFESLPEEGGPAAGAFGDRFIQQSKANGATPMLTMPMIGWVAKLGPNRGKLSSFSIAKYGAQCSVDPYDTDAGDGKKPDCSTLITGNDPHDAYVPDSAAKEKGWVQHLVAKWGKASAGGLGYYMTDNESSIWQGTHRDIHPVGPHATEIRDDVIAYSKMIKSVDASAKVVGPEEWGYEGYFYSGYDQQYAAAHGYNGVFPDRQNAMGGMDYIPWLLQQWKKAGGRPIDVLSVHFYPQGNEFSDDDSAAIQALRNRSTRQLWDKNYKSESWIGAPVFLIPRMKGWAQTYYYAGTPTAITEYNWGDEGHINGATTQADIYGIFGREGLDMATRWTVPANTTPTFKAMKIYRNYDGKASGFGDISVKAGVPQPDNLSAFAAVRSAGGALTVMVINKVAGATPVTLNLGHFTATGSAAVYRLTAANAIVHPANVAWTAGKLKTTVPGQSVTLFVLPK